MARGSRAGVESRLDYLRRLSVVFADELRLKIVTELFLREMSAKQFHEEFGGGSIPRVDRHFKKLAKFGWLRHVRSETGGRRRGATEHFYRATGLAVFDNETWSQLPYSIRIAFDWKTFRQLGERVTDALRAGTLDARANSHLSWTPLLLDQRGWMRIAEALEGLFELLFEEQEQAGLRLHESGESSILTTVALAAFESPGSTRYRHGARPQLIEVEDPAVPMSRRLSRVFADPLCLKIVTELNLREMSASQFYAEFGGDSPSGVRRRFKVLAEIGWLKKTCMKTGGRRRGATEHFYRATGPAIYDNETWSELPSALKASYSWRTFEQLAERVKEAIETGTLEAQLDNHLSWSLLRLDQQGWENVVAAVDAFFESVRREQKEAEARLAKSGEEPIPTTVALAAFESPQDGAKAP